MKFQEIPSAWRGHEGFAECLVRMQRPKVIVDLGVDYGFSTIAFARPGIGTVYAIDHFKGDHCAGVRNIRSDFEANIADAGVKNVRLIAEDFNTAYWEWPPRDAADVGGQKSEVRKSGEKAAQLPIDILHIDGCHAYDSARNDFRMWSTLVRDGGVILMHDTQSFPNDSGRFFREIIWPKFEFPHSGGLGVIIKRVERPSC